MLLTEVMSAGMTRVGVNAATVGGARKLRSSNIRSTKWRLILPCYFQDIRRYYLASNFQPTQCNLVARECLTSETAT
jgi:hypothetical protein